MFPRCASGIVDMLRWKGLIRSRRSKLPEETGIFLVLDVIFGRSPICRASASIATVSSEIWATRSLPIRTHGSVRPMSWRSMPASTTACATVVRGAELHEEPAQA